MRLGRAALIALVAPALALALPPPPATPVATVVEPYHGAFVGDRYRWMEDTASPETRAWFEAQNAYARGILDALPGRAALRNEVASLLSANADVQDVRRAGERIFLLKRDPGAPSYRLAMRQGLDGAERIVLDRLRPRRSADGTLFYDGATRDVTERRRLEDELRLARGAAELRARTDELTGAYNRRYLMEVLGLVDTENATLELTGALNPGILRAAGDSEFLYVVMPMQA